MRRLYSRRTDLDQAPETPGLLRHEGSELRAEADEGPWLRPYAADVPLPDPLPPQAAGRDPGLGRAREQERLGRRLDAITTLQQRLAEEPHHVEARLYLARLLEGTGDPEGAATLLTAGLALDPGAPGLHEARGALLTRLGQHGQAEADLRRAMALQPATASGTMYLGLTLLRRGRHAEAIPLLAQAAGLDPSDGAVLFHLGEARAQAGDLSGALVDLQRAARLLPHDPRPCALAGRLLDRLGRTDEAMEMHRQARLAGQA